jgi:hypothetical protein
MLSGADRAVCGRELSSRRLAGGRDRFTVLRRAGVFGRCLVSVGPTCEKPRRRPGDCGNLGMLLRSVAALEAMEAFASLGVERLSRLQGRATAIEEGTGEHPRPDADSEIVRLGIGLERRPDDLQFRCARPGGQATIRTNCAPSTYTNLARRGVLLGQPVGLGRFGGLRIAVGARDLLPDARADGRPARSVLGAEGNRSVVADDSVTARQTDAITVCLTSAGARHDGADLVIGPKSFAWRSCQRHRLSLQRYRTETLAGG